MIRTGRLLACIRAEAKWQKATTAIQIMYSNRALHHRRRGCSRSTARQGAQRDAGARSQQAHVRPACTVSAQGAATARRRGTPHGEARRPVRSSARRAPPSRSTRLPAQHDRGATPINCTGSPAAPGPSSALDRQAAPGSRIRPVPGPGALEALAPLLTPREAGTP